MAYRGGFTFGYGLTPWVTRLLVANTVMYLITAYVDPGLGFTLGFMPAAILSRPWTLATYMFVHANFMHLFFNMLPLFFFGPPLESRWGSKEFIKFYLICGFGGAMLSFLTPHALIVGASGAIFGVMLGFAMNWPDAPIYIWGIFPIPAKILVAIFAAIALFSAFGGRMDNVAHFAHLGGFAAAFIYIKWERYRGPKGMRKFRKMMTKRRLTVVPGGPDHTDRPGPAGPSSGQDAALLDQLDRVLDKISSSGMSSLTSAERKLLDDASRRYRQN